MTQPTLYMLVGVPASGKSTWLKQQQLNHAVVLSTDDWIEQAAASQNKTYSEVFAQEIKPATKHMNQELQRAITHQLDVAWDQTNLTIKSRANKLAQIPDSYHRVAVFFPTPGQAEHQRRLDSRPGKVIPRNVIMGMRSQLEAPTVDEGFDRIIVAN
jgi:predicted kinase